MGGKLTQYNCKGPQAKEVDDADQEDFDPGKNEPVDRGDREGYEPRQDQL